ncbi:MAG: undecaprenyl-diphosphate phosphatase, partial [Chloroflexota bacterium]
SIGILQGLTEFLPISSSAHLTLLPPALGWTDPLLNSAAFVVMLHLGTLAALLLVFWRDLLRIAAAGIDLLRTRRIDDDPDRRLAVLLALSVVPAAVVGALFEDFFDTWFRENLLLIPVTLAAGALLLWVAERRGRRDRGLADLPPAGGLAIGAAQALALVPGISRSGVTISAGLFVGLRRDDAARFAFLMGVPIIAGAGLWKARSLVAAPPAPDELAALVAGMLAAAVSGLVAIRGLLRYLRTRGLGIFVAYRLVAAVVFLALLLPRAA